LESELEAPNHKEIFPFSYISLVNFNWLEWSNSVGRNWYTSVIPENWPRYAFKTLTPSSPRRNCYTADIRKVAAGRD